jgi:prepilin-type N-terminal cleavage/methylation domain-containing protein
MIRLQHKKRKVQARGFTLIEMLVSLMLFSIIVTICMGTLLVMIDVNAKAQALYSSTTNLTFALDKITREVRTGYSYNCYNGAGTQLPTGQLDCSGGNTAIAFTPEITKAIRIGYRLNAGAIEQNYHSGGWVPLTSVKDVIVETFTLKVNQSSIGGAQPSVDLFIQGKMSNGLDVDTAFSIQSRIIQRRLDIL